MTSGSLRRGPRNLCGASRGADGESGRRRERLGKIVLREAITIFESRKCIERNPTVKIASVGRSSQHPRRCPNVPWNLAVPHDSCYRVDEAWFVSATQIEPGHIHQGPKLLITGVITSNPDGPFAPYPRSARSAQAFRALLVITRFFNRYLSLTVTK